MPSLARRAPTVIPAAVLLLVAGWQAIRVETHDQSPWVGGGFSMFAYVDGDQYRPIVAVDADDPGTRLPIPSHLRREAERLKSAPTDDRAARFAALLSEGGSRRVRVEVWRPVFDAEGLSVRGEMLAAGISP
jgi:hypothetical protein